MRTHRPDAEPSSPRAGDGPTDLAALRRAVRWAVAGALGTDLRGQVAARPGAAAPTLAHLGAGSLDLAEILLAVEGVAGVALRAGDLADLVAVRDAVADDDPGFVTAAGPDQLRRVLWRAGADHVAGRLALGEVLRRCTVDDLVEVVLARVVDRELDRLAAGLGGVAA